MQDLFSLKGRKAMVIGGAGGIGQAIAQGLAFYGADVAIASRNTANLAEAPKRSRRPPAKRSKRFRSTPPTRPASKNWSPFQC
jgi:gluconate 5-dehydrogenase